MNIFLKIIFFIFSILMAGCGDSQQNKENVNPETMAQASINNQGVIIDHNMYGTGDYTLLFVHGWCINQTYWSSQVESLKSAYRIVTIDLPGFGKSGNNRDDWTVEAFGQDINSVIDQLKLTNVIFIGHSMGGDIILEAALKNKEVVALIGIDNFKDVGVEVNEEMKAEIDGFVEMLQNNFTAIAPAYAEGFLFHTSTDSLVKARVIEDFIKSDSSIAIASLESLFEYALIESEQLSKLEMKLYLINSDATPTNIAGLDATGVVYEVVDINATGHYPMIEKPDEFNSLLKQIIKRIEAER